MPSNAFIFLGKRSMEIYTIQMARWRTLKEFDIKLVDATAKSGHRFLAPTWSMVMGIKRNEITEEDYTTMYLEAMKLSMSKEPELWDELLTFPKIALACYCSADSFCHRFLLKDILSDYAKVKDIEVQLMGEFHKALPKDKSNQLKLKDI